MKTQFNKLAAAIGISCLVAVPTVFAEGSKIELNGAVGHYLFDDDRRLTDEPFWGLGVGYAIDPNWTVEAWWTKANSSYFGVDVNPEEMRLDALYHLDEQNGITPYFVAGIGDVTYDVKNSADPHETRINLGVGLKKSLTDHLNFRGDVRMFNSLDEEQTDFGIQLGLNYAFGKATPKFIDSDGDGVEDGADACPNTPAGASVNAQGCPLDSDGDGVFDYRDKCPNTAKNLKVDADGCPIKLTKAVSIELKVNFDNNSAVVKPEYLAEIKRVSDFMRQYANTVVEIQGHTDSSGAADYNMQLSQRRAEAVAKKLVSEFGVPAGRVTAKGYGKNMPVASNSTKEGRAANRRVVAQVQTKVETMQTR
ncbi:MAG: OmpA family protein [Gammaproteobacteria bacterium]|nr:OmpA family protein [Gammaproteobacteria bacterium]